MQIVHLHILLWPTAVFLKWMLVLDSLLQLSALLTAISWWQHGIQSVPWPSAALMIRASLMCYKLLKGRYFNPLQLFYVCRGRRKAARVERHVLSTPVYQVSWDSYHGCKVPEAEKYLRSFIVSADFRIVHRQLSTTKRMIRTTQKKSNFSLRFTLRCSNQHL